MTQSSTPAGVVEMVVEATVEALLKRFPRTWFGAAVSATWQLSRLTVAAEGAPLREMECGLFTTG